MKDKKKHIKDEVDEEIEEVTEDIYPMDATGPAKKIDKLKKEANSLKEEKQKLLDSLTRAKADFVNMRRRDEEDKQNFLKLAKKDFVLEILPVLDSFELAFKDESFKKAGGKWQDGLNNIYSKLLSVLKKEGASEIGVARERFNPEYHTAVSTTETSKQDEDDTVAEVLQKGYIFNGKIIRSAKVVIKQYKN